MLSLIIENHKKLCTIYSQHMYAYKDLSRRMRTNHMGLGLAHCEVVVRIRAWGQIFDAKCLLQHAWGGAAMCAAC